MGLKVINLQIAKEQWVDLELTLKARDGKRNLVEQVDYQTIKPKN